MGPMLADRAALGLAAVARARTVVRLGLVAALVVAAPIPFVSSAEEPAEAADNDSGSPRTSPTLMWTTCFGPFSAEAAAGVAAPASTFSAVGLAVEQEAVGPQEVQTQTTTTPSTTCSATLNLAVEVNVLRMLVGSRSAARSYLLTKFFYFFLFFLRHETYTGRQPSPPAGGSAGGGRAGKF